MTMLKHFDYRSHAPAWECSEGRSRVPYRWSGIPAFPRRSAHLYTQVIV